MPPIPAAARQPPERQATLQLKRERMRLYREQKAAAGPSAVVRCIATLMLLLPGGTAALAGQYVLDDYERRQKVAPAADVCGQCAVAWLEALSPDARAALLAPSTNSGRW